MPAGLEVYDQYGNLKVGLGTRLMRFLGSVVVPGGSGAGSLTNDGLLTGTPFHSQTMFAANGSGYFPGDNMYPMSVWFAGNTMNWVSNAGMPDKIVQYWVHS